MVPFALKTCAGAYTQILSGRNDCLTLSKVNTLWAVFSPACRTRGLLGIVTNGSYKALLNLRRMHYAVRGGLS